ncbi:hypothetical protein DLAC_09394 [Tieghemostelium lacteum]|uniref:F-box domain-containing protein n=1 Tax=Tieghemostelium lacteum TaxID=361077 RepID=A0A151Z9Y2_TIELA|nr:hypothetical protein DLAC_09394 [Tieghemostelium lacteum]|eukprot:KYQ90756.1 hypothetical protein DLAC_09394 [Tieghemostelium lacteum]
MLFKKIGKLFKPKEEVNSTIENFQLPDIILLRILNELVKEIYYFEDSHQNRLKSFIMTFTIVNKNIRDNLLKKVFLREKYSISDSNSLQCYLRISKYITFKKGIDFGLGNLKSKETLLKEFRDHLIEKSVPLHLTKLQLQIRWIIEILKHLQGINNDIVKSITVWSISSLQISTTTSLTDNDDRDMSGQIGPYNIDTLRIVFDDQNDYIRNFNSELYGIINAETVKKLNVDYFGSKGRPDSIKFKALCNVYSPISLSISYDCLVLLPDIIQELIRNQKLEILKLVIGYDKENVIPDFFRVLKEHPSLTELKLLFTNCDIDTLPNIIVDYLSSNRVLRSLYLDPKGQLLFSLQPNSRDLAKHNTIRNTSLQRLSTIPFLLNVLDHWDEGNPNLEEIQLHFSELERCSSTEGFVNIYKKFPNLSVLSSTFSGEALQIHNESMVNLVIKHCPSLKELVFSATRTCPSISLIQHIVSSSLVKLCLHIQITSSNNYAEHIHLLFSSNIKTLENVEIRSLVLTDILSKSIIENTTIYSLDIRIKFKNHFKFLSKLLSKNSSLHTLTYCTSSSMFENSEHSHIPKFLNSLERNQTLKSFEFYSDSGPSLNIPKEYLKKYNKIIFDKLL